MKVILTENVPTLGNIGEIVNVSQGHGRNFLIPKGKAVLADAASVKQMENTKRAISKKMNEEREKANQKAKNINGRVIEFVKRVGSDGRLFGAVTNTDISKALEAIEIEVPRRQIVLENPIKSLGEHTVTAKLFEGVVAEFKAKVIIDPKQADELKKKQEAAAKAKKARAEAEAKKHLEAESAESEESSEETTEA